MFRNHPLRLAVSIYIVLFFSLNIPLHSEPLSQSGHTYTYLHQNLVFKQLFLEHGLSQSIVQCIAQDREGFMWFGTEDGLNWYNGYEFKVLKHNPEDSLTLSYNNITALHVDRAGIIWIGTFHAGLNRLDPKTGKIERYTHDPSDPESLTDNNINAIFEDSRGRLWIGTDKGLNRLQQDPATQTPSSFFAYKQTDLDLSVTDHYIVRDIIEDSSGALWFGSDNGLTRVRFTKGNDQPDMETFRHLESDKNSLSSNSVRCILQDGGGTIWVGTDDGLNRMVVSSNGQESPVFKRYDHDDGTPGSLSNNQVFVLYEDRTGLFWIGTNGGGLNLMDRDTDTFFSFSNDPLNRESLSYNQIRDIYEDQAGIIWIGTYGGGINKINKQKLNFKHFKADPFDENSLNENIVWSVREDKHGTLWIGTHGGGLNRFNPKNNRWRHFRFDPKDPNSLSNDFVRTVFIDNKGVFWIGTHGGGINRFDPDSKRFDRFMNNPNNPLSLSHSEIRTIYQDSRGDLWIGTYGGGLDKLAADQLYIENPNFMHFINDPDDSASISHNIVRAIYEDSEGLFWIGTEGGGLNIMDRKTGTFTRYRHNDNIPGAISNNYIFCIFEDTKQNIWISTWGGGLNRYHRETDSFSYYTVKDGLPDDTIYGILEDDDGNLWMSSNNGISRFNPEKKTFRNFTKEDGLQSNEFNGGSYYESPSGIMYFGGINGFNAFHPDRIRENTHVPPIVLTAFRKLNREVSFEQPLSHLEQVTLSYKDYFFSISFAALDFAAPEKNRYAYKMEGLDEEWITTDATNRLATYTTLSPGNYIFRVKGTNSDGVWNTIGTQLKIVITPPYWEHTWFQMLVLVIIAGFSLFLYSNRLKTVKMKAELESAHDMQMSILPQSRPAIRKLDIASECLPANEVGGDFYDYFRVDEERSRLGIAIGDVAGKAMKAAMIAVLTDGMISTASQETDSTAGIMSRVNRSLFGKIERNMFTALLLAEIDTEKGRLRFTNAGLNKPVYKNQTSLQYIEANGQTYPLGMLNEVVYEEKEMSVTTGDLLVFMTDGVVEARNSKKENYGDDRLLRVMEQLDTSLLSAEEIKNRIIADVKHFTGTAPQFDDMALVVVKIL